jgi:hypothetical protein
MKVCRSGGQLHGILLLLIPLQSAELAISWPGFTPKSGTRDGSTARVVRRWSEAGCGCGMASDGVRKMRAERMLESCILVYSLEVDLGFGFDLMKMKLFKSLTALKS